MTEHVGFTGTREVPTTPQVRARGGVMSALPLDCVFHHGCCIGSDTVAHWLAVYLRLPVEGHPALVPDHLRAPLHFFADVHKAKPPLDRNNDIVWATTRLIATPRTMAEEQRSGTWSTIRKASALNRAVTIVWPDGTVSHEFPRAEEPKR